MQASPRAVDHAGPVVTALGGKPDAHNVIAVVADKGAVLDDNVMGIVVGIAAAKYFRGDDISFIIAIGEVELEALNGQGFRTVVAALPIDRNSPLQGYIGIVTAVHDGLQDDVFVRRLDYADVLIAILQNTDGIGGKNTGVC